MRRPIAFIFAAFAGGIWTGYYLGFWWTVSLFGTLALPSLLLRKQHLCIFLTMALMGACYFHLHDSRPEPLANYEDHVISVTGTVLNVEDRGNYLRLLLKPDSWQCGNVAGTVQDKLIVNLAFSTKERGMSADEGGDVSVAHETISDLFGNKVQVKGKLSLPSGSRNPGLFDYKLYLKTRRIAGIITASDSHLEIAERGNRAIAAMGKLKYSFSDSLDRFMDRDAKALLFGILFGDKLHIDDEIYEDFQRNGCAHILSVSGIHVSIIYVYICRLFRNRRNPIVSACASGILFFYAALANFSDTVVRAFLMIIVHILSKFLHRRYDLLCCTSFSAFLMLLYNPFYLFSLGFQLSYLAVFTLAFALPLAVSKIEKLNENKRYERIAALLHAAAPLFIIQAGMAPASAYHFQYFSFSAFLINFPVIMLAGLILPLGMGLIALSFNQGFLFGFGATAAELLIEIMIQLNRFAGEVGFSSMTVKSPSVWMLVIYYGLFFFFTSESFWILYRNRNKVLIVSICIFILCISVVSPYIMGENERRADIVFVDVGQGDCIHLRTPSGKNILIDGGGSTDYDTGKKVLLPYLLKNGVDRVDLAVVTHLHQDHYGGIASLCRLMPVRKLAVYHANRIKEEEILYDTGLDETQMIYVAAGNRLHIEDDIYIDILYPNIHDEETSWQLISEEADENLCSLVLRVSYKGISLLVTGDMGFEGERLLMDSYKKASHEMLRADILKVGHHGSRFSTGDQFLDAVSPQAAVIQVGKNNFGHPHPDVIEKLEKKGIIVFRNDRHGAVLLDVRKTGVRFRTMI
ncbi:MAG TPA: DNA internalization-related competence protein ComEC/Rec2 [Bacillota bacterium]|nr:DNA internalization-related competence protein ComEC/Rec2 [Bacillota bacterium]HPZ59776.1 DNA internalization-related competence protein ComEC/Rec2 [Bacillota bacterium]HQC82351.1 DNA internalization-related competence protein ComEC/Rec2 [Bacillota bacterium]